MRIITILVLGLLLQGCSGSQTRQGNNNSVSDEMNVIVAEVDNILKFLIDRKHNLNTTIPCWPEVRLFIE